MAFEQTECCRLRRFPSTVRLATARGIRVVRIHLDRWGIVRCIAQGRLEMLTAAAGETASFLPLSILSCSFATAFAAS